MMIDPVAFRIGSLEIRWYGIFISIAVLLGFFLTLREARRKDIKEDFFLDLALYVIPAAIIGARLYYVIFTWEAYQDNLLKIFAVREGGLAIHGVIIAGLLVFIIMTRRYKVSFWKTVDTVAPALILGQAIGRWGNFINREAHGGIVSKEFIGHFPVFIQKQMYINGSYYHPAFLYESLWNFLVFAFLMIIRRKSFIKDGDIFFLYLIGYSLGRFFIEGIRTDSLMLGPIRVAQLISIIAIVAGGVLIFFNHRKEQV